MPNWTPELSSIKEQEKNSLQSMLDGAIASEGEEAVAQRLEANATEAIALADEILYGSGDKEGNFRDARTQINEDKVRFSTLITGRILSIEERKNLEEEAESTEIYN